MKKFLYKTHFSILIILIINKISMFIGDIDLNNTIAFCLQILLQLSGIILFFYTIKPLKIRAFYFGLYPFILVCFIIGRLTKVILLLMIGTLFYTAPLTPTLKNADYYVHYTFQGSFEPCCLYTIYQEKYFVFKKRIGDVVILSPHDISQATINVNNDSLYFNIHIDRFDYNLKKDIPTDTTYTFPLNK